MELLAQPEHGSTAGEEQRAGALPTAAEARQALCDLDPDVREVLDFVVRRRCSYRAAAAALGRSEQAVLADLRRGVRQMASALHAG